MIINLYGFFIALGILVGLLVIDKIMHMQFFVNEDDDGIQVDVFSVFPWVLIPGIIGARLYHVIDYWKYYGENPVEILMVWQGGLGIFGGIIGGIVGIFTVSFYSALRLPAQKFFSSNRTRKSSNSPYAQRRDAVNKKKENFRQAPRAFVKVILRNSLSLLDLGAIGLSIGQAIGRWGNYFNQELYGSPTDLPWGIYIRPENRLVGFENFTHFHPLFLYESIGCLIIFIILITVYSLLFTRKKVGTTFFLYLFLYSFLRFWLEFLRIEGWEWGGAGVNQLVTLGLMIVSGHFLWKRSSHPVIGRA